MEFLRITCAKTQKMTVNWENSPMKKIQRTMRMSLKGRAWKTRRMKRTVSWITSPRGLLRIDQGLHQTKRERWQR